MISENSILMSFQVILNFGKSIFMLEFGKLKSGKSAFEKVCVCMRMLARVFLCETKFDFRRSFFINRWIDFKNLLTKIFEISLALVRFARSTEPLFWNSQKSLKFFNYVLTITPELFEKFKIYLKVMKWNRLHKFLAKIW